MVLDLKLKHSERIISSHLEQEDPFRDLLHGERYYSLACHFVVRVVRFCGILESWNASSRRTTRLSVRSSSLK